MSKKFKLIILTLIMLFPVNTRALSCDYNEQARLRKIATNVVASYTYEENQDNVTFNVTLTNINSDLYIVDSITGIRYDYNGTNEITIGGYKPGTNIRYTIYTTKSDCMDSYLSIKYVNLPYYNKYYKDSLCEGANYNICSKWQPVTYSYDEFVKKINSYKQNNINVPNEETEEDTNETLFDIISGIIMNYYLYIIGVSAILISLVSYFKGKKNKYKF